jgi:hypothetical protein
MAKIDWSTWTISESELSPDGFRKYLEISSPTERAWMFRLWVTEGLPHAFNSAPLDYEAIREFLAVRVGVGAKDVFVVGSAGIGFSLAPKSYGRPFTHGASDLDLAIVNTGLLHALAEDFERWKTRYASGDETPKNQKEQGFWDDNISVASNQIRRGFVDSNKVPNRKCCEAFRILNQTIFLVDSNLQAREKSRKFSKISCRVYGTWDDYFKQAAINVGSLLKDS